MTFTTLKKGPQGVPFLAAHLERLLGDRARDSNIVHDFKAQLGLQPDGIISVQCDAHSYVFSHRSRSRYFDGIPLRYLPTPLSTSGPVAKCASPSEYDAVRQAGIATILTDPSGQELFEACSSALLGWTGAGLVMTPDDRPRVQSIAEKYLKIAMNIHRVALRKDAGLALLLVNAVGVFTPEHGPVFPPEIRGELEALFVRETVPLK